MLTPEEEAHKIKLLQEIKDMESNARARLSQQQKSRIYSFANVPSPEMLSDLLRFQRIFSRYAPWLLESEHATIRVHGAMHDGLIFNPPQTINKKLLESDINKFRKAIEVLADIPIWSLNVTIAVVPPPPPIDDPEDVKNVARSIYDCLIILRDAKNYYGNLSLVLDEMESWARESAKYVPDRRNINWQAVGAVDRLRGYWESMTETSAPSRALNQASPFADFLRDAFDFFGISGDPISAFKRWAALNQAEPETHK